MSGEIPVDDAVRAINEHLASTRADWTPVTPTTRLDELQLDSFDLAEIVIALEEVKGVRLSLESIADLELVSDVAAKVEVA